MNNDLISRYKLKEILLEGWCVTDKSDVYRKGLMDAIRITEVIKPVNAVELPCKIEDKIFEVCKQRYKIYERTVKGFSISDKVEMICCETKNFLIREIGDTAFFTREEAEEALEKLKSFFSKQYGGNEQ